MFGASVQVEISDSLIEGALWVGDNAILQRVTETGNKVHSLIFDPLKLAGHLAVGNPNSGTPPSVASARPTRGRNTQHGSVAVPGSHFLGEDTNTDTDCDEGSPRKVDRVKRRLNLGTPEYATDWMTPEPRFQSLQASEYF